MFTKLSRLGRIATLAVLAAAALPAAAAQAATSPCPGNETSQVFAPFGDLRDYYLAPGGDFEGGITWAKSGAVSLAQENEPFYLAGARDRTSARMGAGGSMTSPMLCVTRDEPYLRFVARAWGSGELDVTVRVYRWDGVVTDTSSGSVSPSAHAVWAPSQLIDLKTETLSVGQGGYVDVSFRSQGDWKVDDVFVDPLRW